MKDDIKNESGISEMLRVITYVLCLLSAVILYPGKNSISCIDSVYDKIMSGHKALQVSVFAHLSVSFVLLLIVSAIVLIFNGILVRSNKKMASVVDIIFYSVLAISVPVFFVLATVLNRAFIVLNKKTFYLIGIMVIFFVIAAIVITKTIRDMRDTKQSKGIAAIAFALLLIVPCIPLFFAVSEANEYKSMYGTFVAGKVTHLSNSEMDMGNRRMYAREYEGKLYYKEGHEIRVLDNGESVTLVTIDDTVAGWRCAFDVYDGKIYYAMVTDDELRIMCNDMNGSEVMVCSDPDPKDLIVTMLIIKDGVLYYDADDEIRYIDLTADTYVSNVYISDLRIDMYEYPLLVYGYEDVYLEHRGFAANAVCYNDSVYSSDYSYDTLLYRSDRETPVAERGVFEYTIYNDKIYFTYGDEMNVLRCMDLDGSNETVVAEFDFEVGRIYCASGHVYVRVYGQSDELITVV